MTTSTTQSGLTALVVTASDIESVNCSDCMLLLSVFSKSYESEVDFKIEVSQATVIVSIGETRQGYIENSTSIKYQIVPREDEETIVTLNSLHQDCAKLIAYSRSPNSNVSTTQIHEDTDENYAVLPKPNATTSYTIEVTGISSCAYQISFTSTKQRIYELHEGVGVDIFLEANEKAYLLYYHSKDESFRLLSMAEYGDISLEGEPLNVTELSDIESIAKSIKNKYSIKDTKQSGFLQINKSNKIFC